MEQPPPAPPPPTIPVRARWTPERQRRFLAALLAGGSVARAAKAAGMSRSSAHRLRARLAGTPFDRAWADALALHGQGLADPLAPLIPAPATRPEGDTRRREADASAARA